MKKAGIIMSAITLGITHIFSLRFAFKLLLGDYSYEYGRDKSIIYGWLVLVFCVIVIVFGIGLLIYTGKYLYSGNKTALGVLILLFICIPGGILIMCTPNEQIDHKTDNNTGGLSKIMSERTSSTSRNCERCGKNFAEDGVQFIVTITGNKKTICKKCYYLAKERGENMTLIKKIDLVSQL